MRKHPTHCLIGAVLLGLACLALPGRGWAADVAAFDLLGFRLYMTPEEAIEASKGARWNTSATTDVSPEDGEVRIVSLRAFRGEEEVTIAFTNGRRNVASSVAYRQYHQPGAATEAFYRNLRRQLGAEDGAYDPTPGNGDSDAQRYWGKGTNDFPSLQASTQCGYDRCVSKAELKDRKLAYQQVQAANKIRFAKAKSFF